MRNIKKFVNESETFTGFSFQGEYGMDTDMFIMLFEHYLKTGENFLDVYSELIWLTWDQQTYITRTYEKYPGELAKYIHDFTECDKLKNCVEISERLKLFDHETNESLLQLIDRYREQYSEFLKKHPKYRKQIEAQSGPTSQKIALKN